MRNLFNNWCYFLLGREEYKKCMEKIFPKNIINLNRITFVFAFLTVCFTLFPAVVEGNMHKARYYLITAVIAALQFIFVRFEYSRYKQEKNIGNGLIYALIILYFVNVIQFGIYLGIWANPGKLAGCFFSILICALFLFNISPILHFFLTISAMLVFMTFAVIFKIPENWGIDVANALFAGIISLFISWQITMFRMSQISAAGKLENERDSYFDQCSIDELTQLKNHRDFKQTFQRFITVYRQSDIFICVAIMDIDFFKNYNDHYGHLQGDECLRAIGSLLNSIKENTGVYVARVGGEEFSMLWFEENADNAGNIASRVNQMLYDLKIPHEKSSVSPYVTISIGVHVAKCGVFSNTQVLYDLADKALYTAKANGRNRVVVTA